MTNEFDDLSDEEVLASSSPLNIEDIKSKLPNYSSQKLCEMIVCDRYFGCYKEIGIMCMEELANRRIAGDTFPFEEVIEKAYGELPVLDFNVIPDVGDVFRQVLGRNK